MEGNCWYLNKNPPEAQRRVVVGVEDPYYLNLSRTVQAWMVISYPTSFHLLTAYFIF